MNVGKGKRKGRERERESRRKRLVNLVAISLLSNMAALAIYSSASFDLAGSRRREEKYNFLSPFAVRCFTNK